MDSLSYFLRWKLSKSAQNVIFHVIWPILGPYDPLKGFLHYQESTVKGSYSLNSLHKLVYKKMYPILFFLTESVLTVSKSRC